MDEITCFLGELSDWLLLTRNIRLGFRGNPDVMAVYTSEASIAFCEYLAEVVAAGYKAEHWRLYYARKVKTLREAKEANEQNK